jgi:hypothetical protein
MAASFLLRFQEPVPSSQAAAPSNFNVKTATSTRETSDQRELDMHAIKTVTETREPTDQQPVSLAGPKIVTNTREQAHDDAMEYRLFQIARLVTSITKTREERDQDVASMYTGTGTFTRTREEPDQKVSLSEFTAIPAPHQ